jgi:hypothetical protein
MLAASLLVAASLLIAGCGNDPIEDPTEPTAPTLINEAIAGTLTVNGAATHPFIVQRAGTVSASLTGLAPDDTVTIGLAIGTWNGTACSIVIANDNATLITARAVVGTATATGAFCVRVYDVGKLTQPIDYSLSLDHY